MTGEKNLRPASAWKPGQSGNSRGRPPGQSKIEKLRQAIGTAAPEVLQRMIQLAMEGDVMAGRLVLERFLPAVKPTELATQINIQGNSLTDKAQSVLQAVADGVIPPGTGSQLLGAIGTMARVAEVDELKLRIEKLENQHGKS